MKRLLLGLGLLLLAAPAAAQITKPVYISLPSAGNIQHLALTTAKYKKFYEEAGVADARVVYLRGNSINVQAILSGSVQFASAFGPSMHAMFRGEQLRVLVQIFNQIPMALITRPEVKKLEELKGQKIAVTFGGSTYSVLIAMLGHFGLPQNFGEYLNMPGDQAKAAALMQGKVAAALMAPPADGPVLKAGFKRLVYMGDVFKGVPFSAMLTTAKIIQEEPDLVERTVRAVVKAMLFLRQNREGGIEMVMKHGQVDRDIATALYDLSRDAFVPALTADGIMKRAELEIATLKERPNFDPKQFMDDRFLKKALAAEGQK
ncbi:MAG TPA: ABC transporter substrate-binding protein [Candidatus Binatia bacterium]|jgi:ABC-type nitrate/sulfonate/bicarbonate transport system substrate-binding protein